MADDWMKFPPIAKPSRQRAPKATLIGVLGPPGSGKTRTVIRLMRGTQRVFPGPIVMIDTEAGRSSIYQPQKGKEANPDDPIEPTYDFERIDLDPPYRGDRCWAAIKEALAMKPAAIGFDNISDEHTGEGGYLWWHDQEVERVGGNEWGAWARPAAARMRLISGITHISPPPILFFTFISQEKTEQITVKDERTGREKKKVIDKGWTPVAPLMILKALDLTLILPWDSEGTPIWEARRLPGEEFARKWPKHLTRLMGTGQITEAHGEALARWVKGEPTGPVQVGGDLQSPESQPADLERRRQLLDQIGALLTEHCGTDKAKRGDALQSAFGTPDRVAVSKMPTSQLETGLGLLRKNLDGLASMRAERQPGEDPEEGV